MDRFVSIEHADTADPEHTGPQTLQGIVTGEKTKPSES